MAESKPYLSFIATSRNDGHGGNIMKRMKLFVKGLLYQSKKFNLPCELIIVEWNPPKDRPLLQEVLPKPQKGDLLTLRYIIVPEEVHKTYKRSNVIPLFQMIAKNVGIRRAKGEFILCTNIDLLFSDELFSELAKKNLKGDCFYRANRCDVPDEIELDWPFEKQMDYSKKHVIRRLGKHYRYLNLDDPPPVYIKYGFLSWALNTASQIKRTMLDNPYGTKFNQLDTNTCGDFTLMSKEAWMDIQGYLELDLYSIHVDSFGVIGAASLGYKQVVFKPEACCYHVDHPTGWESMSPIEKIKFSQERPGLGFEILYETAVYMLQHKTHYNINQPEWGFLEMRLDEYEFTG